METAAGQQPERRKRRFGRLAKTITLVNIGAFSLSLANELTVHSPVSFSQTAMEAADTVLPLPLIQAEAADRQGNVKKAVGWRMLTNSIHTAAGAVGLYEATTFINNPAEVRASNIAISACIGLWNLGIIRRIRKFRAVEANYAAESGQDSSVDRTNTRNIDNLGVLATTNIIEAIPPFIAPLAQLAYQNGSAATVIAANAVVIAMSLGQIGKDISLVARNPQEHPDIPNDAM